MPLLSEPQCPQCLSTLSLRQLWRVAPTGRSGLLLVGKVGVVCPHCGAKLRVLQGGIGVVLVAAYALFVIGVLVIRWLTHEGGVKTNQYALVGGLAVCIGGAQILLSRWAPHLANLRSIEDGEEAAYPLELTKATPPKWSRTAAIALVTLMGLVLIVTFTGLDTTTSMNAIFGTLIPGIAAAGSLALMLPRVFASLAKPGNSGWDYLKVLLGVIVISALVAYLVRDGIRTLGVVLGGSVSSIDATVQGTRTTARGRCEEFATFQLEHARTVEVCVRRRFRANLIDTHLDSNEQVTLLVQSNLIGEAVVGIRR
jgi:hypothetical protein